jgi:hypothetical protein
MDSAPVLPPRTSRSDPSIEGKAGTKPTLGGGSTTDVKPLEGKTTIDDAQSIECEILCYEAISAIAGEIATRFLTKVPNGRKICVIFLDPGLKAGLQLQQGLVVQSDLLKRGFDAIRRVESEQHIRAEEVDSEQLVRAEGPIVPESALFSLASAAAAPAISGVTTLSKSVLDLLALFRTDVTISGRKVALSEEPLAYELADKLSNGRTDGSFCFVYPRAMPYRPAADMQDSAKLIEARLSAVIDSRAAAQQTIEIAGVAVSFEEARLSDAIQAAADRHKHKQHDAGKDTELNDLKAQVIERRLKLERLKANFGQLDSQWQALQSALNRGDAGAGATPLQLIQQAEEVISRFGDFDTSTYLLSAQVSTVGGSVRVSRNLWRSLFWSEGVRYSGGAIVSFGFFDKNAHVILSGSLRYREPFTRFRSEWGSSTTGNSF